MADKRCPLCSQTNPAEAEVCQHCQARLKPLVAGDAPPADAEKNANADPTSDWLGDFRSADSVSDAGDEHAFDDDSAGGDWFSRLGDESPLAAAKPDWLGESTQAGDPSIPDWIEELGVQSKPASQPAADESSTVDLRSWLNGLVDDDESVDDVAADDSPAASGAGSQASSATEGDFSDWLGSLGAQDAQTKQVDEALPDWLQGAQTGDEPDLPWGASASSPDSDETDDQLPDWLTAPGGLPEPEVPIQFSEPAAASDQTPDWLADFGSLDFGSEDDDQETLSPPTWLADAGDETSSDVEIPSEEEVLLDREPPTQPVPDWLSQYEQVSAMASEGEPYPDGATDDSDWLTPTAESFAAGGVTAGMSDFDRDAGADAEPSAPLDDAPDWLSEMGSLALAEGDTPAETSSAFVFDDATADLADDGVLEMPDLSETPDWLANVSAADARQDEGALAGAEFSQDADASPADLPVWLESMRPVESALPPAQFRDEADSRIESAGPLSGLRGILQAEPDISNFRKPPVYVNKLQLSDGYQAHVALLKELTDAEGRPQPVQAIPPIKSQSALRWIIFVAFLASTFFGLMLGDVQRFDLPGADLPPEIRNLRSAIEALPPDAPVLVAVDYETATSAEMIYPVSQVVGHLQEKEAFLALVSTRLTGPMLAELMLNQIENQQVISYTHYTNFGYIPGGPVGLLSFARSPKQTLPHALTGDGWSDPALSNVWRMQDFALVVVMTDDADVARNWVEQVRPRLDDDTSLVMVLSAQAEPMVRPYFQPSLDETWLQTPDQVQVSGYLAGITGAAAYQAKFAQPEIFKEWDAYVMTSLIAIVIIALGGLANLGMAMSSRPKSKR